MQCVHCNLSIGHQDKNEKKKKIKYLKQTKSQFVRKNLKIIFSPTWPSCSNTPCTI